MTYEAHKRSLWRFSLGVVLVGTAFLCLSVVWPDAMRQEEYGAKAYAIPAEIWALGFISGGGLIIYGLHINGRKPLFTPAIRLLGLMFLIGLFGYLAYSALSAPGGAVIVIFSTLFFIPYLWHFAIAEARQLALRWRIARNVSR